MSTDRPKDQTHPWWSDVVGYEVYIRSFSDGNGDGIGDLAGLTAKLDHLDDLGIECIWVTPFYPSPMADHGYDVADYCGVDPSFGALEDVDILVASVHERGMKLIIDLVPNHSSDQHPWFQDALRGPGSAHREHYLWRDPAADGGPPNNWRSHFGGPAWTFDEASGQYWCHLFLPEQPDLNWRSEAVRAQFRQILSFWLDRGVDGFRIDVAHSLTKDPNLRDNPVRAELAPDASPRSLFRAMNHVHDLDQHDNLDVYREWRTLTEPRDAVLLGEVYLDTASAVSRYIRGDALDATFYFPTVHATWTVDDLRTVVNDVSTHGRGRFAWVHSSHDDPRAPTRFGGGNAGRQRALAFQTFTAFLPGPFFLYQGDELGLENGHVAPEDRHDPVATRNDDPSDGRDPVRTPMPWEPDEPNLGFSTGAPWLPVGANHGAADTAAVQWADPDSHLHAVRAMLQRRRQAITDLGLRPDDQTETVDVGALGIARRRGPLLLVLAVSGPVDVDRKHLPEHASVLFAIGDVRLRDGVHLPTDSVAVIVGGVPSA